MSAPTIVTGKELNDEAVSLVRLPRSPTMEPTTPSNLSTLTSLSSSDSAILDPNIAIPINPVDTPEPSKISVNPSHDRVSTAIPTPKSTIGSDTSPPPPLPHPEQNSTPSPSRPSTNNPQAQDNCMFCTPETAPPGENLEWIQCNGCKRWAHTLCTGLSSSMDILSIDKFHCKRCEKTRGPTTCLQYSGIVLTIDRPPPRKSERAHLNIDYTSLNLGDTTNILPDQHAYNAFFEGDAPRKFAPDRFKRMEGHELTKKWAEETGCKDPVVIPKGHSDGMGMTMPVDLTVRKVAELVGEDTRVEVIGTTLREAGVNVDVPTQKEVPNWRLKQWADYYDAPTDQRDRVRNVISLEVSSSALGAQVVRPQFVRDLDLIEKVWPSHLRPTSSTSANPNHASVVLPTASNTASTITFPKVTLYCLMSVARAYTDFHVDFGGSSVFYHILRGNKTFLFIEPTAANLRRYEAWCGDSEQARRFLGEEVKECIRVDLTAGDTMIIPSGWIHAVYTPTDSLVLGGNFLTPIHIPSQLNISNIETKTRVPKKFRFPFFDMAMWYTAIYYLDIYIPRRKRGPMPKTGRRNTEGMSKYEIEGLKTLADWLWKKAKLRTQQLARGAEFHRAKVEVPPGIDAVEIATRFAKWIYDADNLGEELPEELPLWYRSEVLLQKVETPKKRKREEGGTPVRKYSRRNGSKPEEPLRLPETTISMEIPPVSSSLEYFSLSRPVTSYSSISECMSRPWNRDSDSSNNNFPLITYPPLTHLSKLPSQPFQIFKPYSQQSSTHLRPDESFLKIVKSLYRPYVRKILLEEIKVEDKPTLEGLHALSEAIELASHVNQQNYPPSESTLTVYSLDAFRLPTPPSQSPSPPVIQDEQLESRERSSPGESSPLTRKRPGPKPKNQRRKPGPKPGWKISKALTESALKAASSPTAKSQNSVNSPNSVRASPRVRPGTNRGRRVTVQKNEAEARRLQGLLTAEEIGELRRVRRRGSDFVFGVVTLRKELERLGRPC